MSNFEDVKLYRIERGGLLKQITSSFDAYFSNIFETIAERDASSPTNGQECLVIENGKTYIYSSPTWTETGTIFGRIGPQGIKGGTGDKGDPGDDGMEVELRKGTTHIEWRYIGTPTWYNLIAIADITGPKGDIGDKGDPGDAAPNLQIEYSIDGTTLWHTNFTAGDKYVRTSSDGGTTWSSGMKFVGEDGIGIGDMLMSTYDTTGNGIVDNSERLGGQLPCYYQPALGFTPYTTSEVDTLLTSINTTLGQKANDSDVVHKTNIAETILGEKFFKAITRIRERLIIYNLDETKSLETGFGAGTGDQTKFGFYLNQVGGFIFNKIVEVWEDFWVNGVARFGVNGGRHTAIWQDGLNNRIDASDGYLKINDKTFLSNTNTPLIIKDGTKDKVIIDSDTKIVGLGMRAYGTDGSRINFKHWVDRDGTILGVDTYQIWGYVEDTAGNTDLSKTAVMMKLNVNRNTAQAGSVAFPGAINLYLGTKSFTSNGDDLYINTGASNSGIVLRPNGDGNPTSQLHVYNNGLEFNGVKIADNNGLIVSGNKVKSYVGNLTGTSLTITHNLGKLPAFIKFTLIYSTQVSVGTYDYSTGEQRAMRANAFWTDRIGQGYGGNWYVSTVTSNAFTITSGSSESQTQYLIEYYY